MLKRLKQHYRRLDHGKEQQQRCKREIEVASPRRADSPHIKAEQTANRPAGIFSGRWLVHGVVEFVEYRRDTGGRRREVRPLRFPKPRTISESRYQLCVHGGVFAEIEILHNNGNTAS